MSEKIILILIVGILVLSGFGAGALSDREIKQEKMTLSFSQLAINENNNFVTLELEWTNSILMII